MRSTEIDEGKRALAFALRILARRDMCSAELSRRLTDRGFPETLAGETVTRLVR